MATKAIHRLMRTIKKLSDGQANVREIDWDEDTVRCFKLEIQPSSGCFEGGTFVFSVLLDDNYPSNKVPIVRCETDIYHPNIDTCDGYDHPQDVNNPAGTNVCLNLFDEGIWNASYGLESIVLGLLFLLDNPNFDNPLSDTFVEIYKTRMWYFLEEYWENVAHYMKGEEVRGGKYFDAHFLSNVDGKAIMPSTSGADDTKSGCDVDSMNEMCASEGNDAKNILTKQGTLILSQKDTLVKQDSFVEHGSLVKQEMLENRRGLTVQECLVKQDGLEKQKSLVRQGSSVNEGTSLAQGSLVKQESVVKQGGLVKQGSILKQGSLVKLCSLVKEASVEKLSSIVSQAEEADAEFDNRAMKMIEDEYGRVFLLNDSSNHGDKTDMDTS